MPSMLSNDCKLSRPPHPEISQWQLHRLGLQWCSVLPSTNQLLGTTAHSNLAIGGQRANVRNATSNMGGQPGSQGEGGAAGGQAINQPPIFQRLNKLLSYLDQVKFKFGNQPIES